MTKPTPTPRPRPRSALARAVAVATSLAILAPALPAEAQAPSKAQLDEASARFKRGVELYSEGDYRAALIEFKRAYELAPNFGVLYNMGQVYFQLQDYVGALSSLERYLADGGSQIPPARRAEVTKDIEKLRQRVAKLDIAVNVEGADVAIDDVPSGKSPFGKPMMVSAGRRKITASKPGYATATKLVDVAGGDSLRVALDLTELTPSVEAPGPAVIPAPHPEEPPKAASSSPTPAPQPAPSQAPEAGSSTPMIVGWSVTGALAAGAAVCGVLALSASSDLKDQREKPGATRSDLDAAKDKTTTLALVTDVLAASAVVAGGVSIYLTASRPSGGADHARAEPSVRLGVAGPGLRLDGTF